MRRMLGFLLILAVLLCGLHLSPAEADQSFGAAGTEIVSSTADHDGDDADHARPHATHACHSHCPVGGGHDGPQFLAPLLVKSTVFAASAKALASLSQAPPVEPPAA